MGHEIYLEKLKKNIIVICFVFLFSAFLALPSVTQAARLYFEPASGSFPPDKPFSVEIMIDTEKDEINTAKINFNFPSEIFEVENFSDGGSIVNFWIERPAIKDGVFSFGGIIAGGFRGKGLLLKIFIVSKKEGKGDIVFGNGLQVLLNDGKGTEAQIKTSPAGFTIFKGVKIPEISESEIKDNDPPEDFKPVIGQSRDIFGGKWFLAFSTQDKKSGIDRYEIQENRTSGIENGKWTRAESPYPLKDQGLGSYIYVRATDKAENSIIAVVLPQKTVEWYDNYWIWIILIIVASAFVYLRRRKVILKILGFVKQRGITGESQNEG